jgi:integrase
VQRALAHAEPPDLDVVEPETITDIPQRKQLILSGRADLAARTYDPDDRVDPETDRELFEGIPLNTRLALEWAWGRAIWWCGRRGRRHDPMTVGSMRQYIKEHWDMTDAHGVKRGRRGRPYAPATVGLAVYMVSTIYEWFGWPNPVKHPYIERQLKAYTEKYERAGFSPDIPDPITHEKNVVLARHCDLATVGGLRNACMVRAQFDIGARASEICHIQIGDVQWETVTRETDDGQWETVEVAIVNIRRQKVGGAAGARKVVVEPDRQVDWDVDPARLLKLLIDALRSAGITSGPLFRDVYTAQRRKDYETSGRIAGTWRDTEIKRDSYAAVFNRLVDQTMIEYNPRTGEKEFHYSTHSNRAGHITESADSGMPLERVADRTGHSPGSKAIYRYFRSNRRKGPDYNSGTRIRHARHRKPAPAGGTR